MKIQSLLAVLSVLSIIQGAEGQTNMTFKQCNEIAVTIPVGRGDPAERLVSLNVQTQGSLNPVSLNSVTFNLDGTTDLNDLDSLKIWYTGANPRLAGGSLFGMGGIMQGTITITGNCTLTEGDNFFWITANVSPGSAEGNFMQGDVDSVKVAGQIYPVIQASSLSKRLIMLEHRLLYSGGGYGSVNYRIPAIITAGNGTLVTAVDARIEKEGDLPNNIDIMVRRSADMGHTWEEPQTIADFGPYGASDPALVKDRSTGTLLCMFASHQGLMASTPANPIRFQVCRSTDNGITWSPPAEHTSEIYAPGWYAAWLASGNAHQQRDGRIVGSIGVRKTSGTTISNFMIYSDDTGLTWEYKPAEASSVGDEAKIVELDNGSLMMNIRNKTPDYRKIVVSEDYGDSWGTPYFQYDLSDPAVNGDFIRYTSVLDGYDKSRLLFSLASHPTIRKNLTVFISYDEGQSWGVSKVINPDASGYSSLTVLSDGTIGCFYENGEYEEYQLYFARFSLEWLTDGNDTFTYPVGLKEGGDVPFDVDLAPNPAENLLNVTYRITKRSNLKATLVNPFGNEMIRVASCVAERGTLQFAVEVDMLPPRLYFLLTEMNGIIYADKVIIH